MGIKFIALLSLAVIILTGCSDKIDPPAGVSELPPKPETPRGLTASIGDGQVALSWTISNQALIDEFVIYYSDSAAVDMLVFDSTNLLSATVDGLVNGRRYFFRVSAIDTSGLEGDKSSPFMVTPGIFSMNIAGGLEFTNTRAVTIAITAPDGTSLLQLSEDPQFGDAHWQAFGGSKSFDLSDSDGLKTVYARFELEAGGNAVDTVSDDITLDRTAEIDFIRIFDETGELTGDALLQDGETLRFEVHVSEKGSNAGIEIEGLDQIVLNDFGIGGDNLAEDNIFGAEYIIPYETEISNAIITGYFTDVAGNDAPGVRSDVRLSVTSVPEPVTVWGYAVTSLQIQLLWNPTEIGDFSRYRIFRADSAIYPDSVQYPDSVLYTDSVLVIEIVKATDSKFLDGGLDDDDTYYYWIYVHDIYGNMARSETVEIRTLLNEPPDTLNIFVNPTGDTLSARIDWVQAVAAEDFMAYYIMRDTDATILNVYSDSADTSYPAELVVEVITDQQTTSFLDRDLPTNGMFYYQVYVADRQGMVSRSNVVSVDIE